MVSWNRLFNHFPHTLFFMNTQELLNWPQDPLVAINGIEKSDVRYMTRSMGFVIEKPSRGLLLIATVRHAFDDTPRTYQYLKTGPLNTVTHLQALVRIDDLPSESDIAFILVKDPADSAIKSFVLDPSDPLLIKSDQVLCNAANRCEHLRRKFDMDVTRQTVTECDELSFCRFKERKTKACRCTDSRKIEQLIAEGWQCCRNFVMQSRPGNSGSPVWNETLELFGMNIRGTGIEGNDILVMIPRGELYLARCRIAPRLMGFLQKHGYQTTN
jgi:hypothetical protein